MHRRWTRAAVAIAVAVVAGGCGATPSASGPTTQQVAASTTQPEGGAVGRGPASVPDDVAVGTVRGVEPDGPDEAADASQAGDSAEVAAGSGAGAGAGVGAGADGDAPVIAPTSGWVVSDVLAADADCSRPLSGQPLVIGYAADLSEEGALFDAVGIDVARHMAGLINCSGGLDGTPVQIEIADVGGPPTATRAAVEGLLEAGASAIIGPRRTDPGLRVLRVTREQGVPVVYATSTEPVLASPAELAFLVGVDDEAVVAAAAEFAAAQGWETAVTFSADGPRFAAGPAGFTERFVETGGAVVGDVGYEASASYDFAVDAAEVAAMDPAPDVVFTTMPLAQVAALRQALIDAGSSAELLGVDGLDPVLASAGPIALTAGADLTLDRLDGVYYVAQASFGLGARPSQLDGSMVIATGSRPGNPTAAALVGDAMVLIGDAYLRSGGAGADAGTLGAAMLQTNDLEAITGRLSYAGRASPAKSVSVMRVVDGRPIEVAVIPPE